jgi:hypothetical protein
MLLMIESELIESELIESGLIRYHMKFNTNAY